jgi:predicted enzyme related to lactoylglutathione lyase
MATRLYSVVIDAADPVRLGRWWADALGWTVTHEASDEVDVDPPDGAEPGLVFGQAADPKVDKNRVHLDLASQSVDDQAAIIQRLLEAGASRAEVGQRDVPWDVLADPEGNEFCVLEPREHTHGRGALASIVVDAAQPESLAAFWAEASGWPIGNRGDRWVALRSPSGRLPDLDFVTVPDPKTVKNRVHLDVAPFVDDDRDLEVARLEALGARRIDVGQGEGPEITWVVLADPEGNEFCVLRPR